MEEANQKGEQQSLSWFFLNCVSLCLRYSLSKCRIRTKSCRSWIPLELQPEIRIYSISKSTRPRSGVRKWTGKVRKSTRYVHEKITAVVTWSSSRLETPGSLGKKSCCIYPPTPAGHWPRVPSDSGSPASALLLTKVGNAPKARESLLTEWGHLLWEKLRDFKCAEWWVFGQSRAPSVCYKNGPQIKSVRAIPRFVVGLFHLVQFSWLIHYTLNVKVICLPVVTQINALGGEYLRTSPLPFGMSQSGGIRVGQEPTDALWESSLILCKSHIWFIWVPAWGTLTRSMFVKLK